MNLVVDIGNTHIVIGVASQGEIKDHYRIETRSGMTADEIANLWKTMIDVELSNIENVYVASVVPELTKQLQILTEKSPFKTKFLEPPWKNLPIDVETDNPHQVGADRVAGATAFYQEFGAGIIVDFGTATTLDLVTENAEYLGGVIFPGIEASATGLSTKAAMLPEVSAQVPEDFSFSDTISGFRSGLFHGTAGAVEKLIDKIYSNSSLPTNSTIVATGGGSSQLYELTDIINHVRPNLVIKGILICMEDE